MFHAFLPQTGYFVSKNFRLEPGPQSSIAGYGSHTEEVLAL